MAGGVILGSSPKGEYHLVGGDRNTFHLSIQFGMIIIITSDFHIIRKVGIPPISRGC